MQILRHAQMEVRPSCICIFSDVSGHILIVTCRRRKHLRHVALSTALAILHPMSLAQICMRGNYREATWTNEELVKHWTLSSKELDLIGDSKTDHNLLGAACLLKYFQYEGRFPSQKQDVPSIVIVHLAQQLGV